MKPTLVIDSHIPFLKGVLEPYAQIYYTDNGEISHEFAMKADGLIIRTRTICNEALLKGTPVKFIATGTIGFDHIDTAYCEATGIQWRHAPGCNAASVRQYMAAALVSFAKSRGFNLKNKTIGIVGVGNVGSKIVQLALALGMRPLLNDPPRERMEGSSGFVSLEEILEKADIISLHVPLNFEGPDKTYHLVDKEFFRKLLINPLLINTSRGAVTDTPAVIRAIKKGEISGHIADVWENEPEPDRRLLKLTDLATPHIAGYSAEGKANGTAACVRTASRYFGFGLDDWYPQELPQPAQPVIKINTNNKSEDQIISEAILATYDILQDDRAFRTDPSSFEPLRNTYPVRREFPAYTVALSQSTAELVNKLKAIGFLPS